MEIRLDGTIDGLPSNVHPWLIFANANVWKGKFMENRAVMANHASSRTLGLALWPSQSCKRPGKHAIFYVLGHNADKRGIPLVSAGGQALSLARMVSGARRKQR